MSNNKITLKQYLTCQNYRKQVDLAHRNRKKSKYAQQILQKNIEAAQKNSLANKFKEIKIFARAIINKDNLFIQLENMLTQLEEAVNKHIQQEEQNFRTVHSILNMITGSKAQSPPPAQINFQSQQPHQDLKFRKGTSIQLKSTLIQSSKQIKDSQYHAEKGKTKSYKAINTISFPQKDYKNMMNNLQHQPKKQSFPLKKNVNLFESIRVLSQNGLLNNPQYKLQEYREKQKDDTFKLARKTLSNALWQYADEDQQEYQGKRQNKARKISQLV